MSLIEIIDGKTSSRDGFSGPIGKKLSEVNSMDRNLRFPPVPLLQPLVKIPDNVMSKMSTDLALSYKLVEALSQGEMTQSLPARSLVLSATVDG